MTVCPGCGADLAVTLERSETDRIADAVRLAIMPLEVELAGIRASADTAASAALGAESAAIVAAITEEEHVEDAAAESLEDAAEDLEDAAEELEDAAESDASEALEDELADELAALDEPEQEPAPAAPADDEPQRQHVLHRRIGKGLFS